MKEKKKLKPIDYLDLRELKAEIRYREDMGCLIVALVVLIIMVVSICIEIATR